MFPTMVEHQPDGFAEFCGKLIDRFVEPDPQLELSGWCECSRFFVWCNWRIAIVGSVQRDPAFAFATACEVKEFATDVNGSQREERSRGRGFHLAQGMQEPEDGILEDIRSVGFAAHIGERANHFLRELLESRLGGNKECVRGLAVARLPAGNTRLQIDRVEQRFGGHGISTRVRATMTEWGSEIVTGGLPVENTKSRISGKKTRKPD